MNKTTPLPSSPKLSELSEHPLLRFSVSGMTCEHCQGRVESAAGEVADVSTAQVDLTAGTLTVSGGDPQAIIRTLAEAGYPATLLEEDASFACPLPEPAAQKSTPPNPPNPPPVDFFKPYLLQLDGITCASCVGRVEQAISAVTGVRAVAVNLVEKTARVEGGDPKQAVAAVIGAGYKASIVEDGRSMAGETYEISILGMHCASCVGRVEQSLLALPGVSEATANLIEKKVQVRGGNPELAVQAIIGQGYEASLLQEAAKGIFFITLLPDPSQQPPQPPQLQGEKLDRARTVLQAQNADIKITVEEEGLRIVTPQHPADVLLQLTNGGFQARLEEAFADPALQQAEETQLEIRRSWQRAILAGLIGSVVMAGHMSGLFPHLLDGLHGQVFWAGVAVLCLFTMIYSGHSYFVGAWKQALHGAANMDTLVALGTGSAWLASVLVIAVPDFIPGGANNLYLDASVMILAFLQLGHVLETRAKRTTSEAIGSLVGLRARTALVIRPAGQAEIPVSLLQIDDHIQVKPGEKVPIDGEIIEGKTTIDESMLTGEPLAVSRKTGDAVTGGTMNKSGAFVLRVSRLGEDTTLAQIIRMVKTAQMSKPPIGRLVDRIAGVFVPVVMAISLASFFAWLGLASELPLAHGLTAAIAVLVIACPCALGLATPIAIMVGTSRAAQHNILIRNSDALQTASSLTHVVVDKTGTLTEGKPAVTAVFPVQGWTKDEVLLWAASLEKNSEHPLAEAVLVAQMKSGEPLTQLDTFTAIPGRGVRAEHAGADYFLGNHHFFIEQGIALPLALTNEAKQQAAQGGTPVWLGRSTEVMGLLILKDPVRRDSAVAVRALQAQGIHVVMCSGDNRATAEAVGREVGITEVHGEILPEEKLDVIRTLQQQGYKVAMVGDGVNDAPALAQANTGFAVGSGTDVAIENADVTLTGDSLLLVADAIAISSATIRNIKQNLFGAFIYNVVGIPLAAGLFYPFTGWMLEPMFASAAMALSSVTVVTNANRLRFFRPRGR